MEQALWSEVVDIFPAAAQEAQILAPFDRSADEGVPHAGSPPPLR